MRNQTERHFKLLLFSFVFHAVKIVKIHLETTHLFSFWEQLCQGMIQEHSTLPH